MIDDYMKAVKALGGFGGNTPFNRAKVVLRYEAFVDLGYGYDYLPHPHLVIREAYAHAWGWKTYLAGGTSILVAVLVALSAKFSNLGCQ